MVTQRWIRQPHPSTFSRQHICHLRQSPPPRTSNPRRCSHRTTKLRPLPGGDEGMEKTNSGGRQRLRRIQNFLGASHTHRRHSHGHPSDAISVWDEYQRSQRRELHHISHVRFGKLHLYLWLRLRCHRRTRPQSNGHDKQSAGPTHNSPTTTQSLNHGSSTHVSATLQPTQQLLQ